MVTLARPALPALFLRIQVRMPSPHLLFNRARHILRTEFAPLLPDHDLKREMQHEIPQFIPDLIATPWSARPAARPDRVVQFEHFFHEIWTQGFASLRRIPGTTFPQASDQLDHPSKRRCFLYLGFHAGTIRGPS